MPPSPSTLPKISASTVPIPLLRPIPPLYAVYLLRSLRRPNSLYIGSTPHPARRLRQHNGGSKGGAVRTGKEGLRPWEMVCLVTGFGGGVGALQFEWALQNPHLTLHIPASARISHSTGRKKGSGQPKRPRHTLTSVLANLRLLLGVGSFRRWPLEVRFLRGDVWDVWRRGEGSGGGGLERNGNGNGNGDGNSEDDGSEIKVVKDFIEDGGAGVEGLDVTYAALKGYVGKAKGIVDFEREGKCAVCSKELKHEKGVYAICPGEGCESVTHLACLAGHFLDGEMVRRNGGRTQGLDEDVDEEPILPKEGSCPACGTKMRWVDVVKEATLRMRGQKEVERLLREKRKKAAKASPKKTGKGTGKGEGTRNGKGKAVIIDEILDSDEDEIEDLEIEEQMMELLEQEELDAAMDDEVEQQQKMVAVGADGSWLRIDEDDDDSDDDSDDDGNESEDESDESSGDDDDVREMIGRTAANGGGGLVYSASGRGSGSGIGIGSWNASGIGIGIGSGRMVVEDSAWDDVEILD